MIAKSDFQPAAEVVIEDVDIDEQVLDFMF